MDRQDSNIKKGKLSHWSRRKCDLTSGLFYDEKSRLIHLFKVVQID